MRQDTRHDVFIERPGSCRRVQHVEGKLGVGGGGRGGQSDITTSCVLSQGVRTFWKVGAATGGLKAGQRPVQKGEEVK